MKFNFEADEVVVGALPLEGESDQDERLKAIEPEAPSVPVLAPVLEAEPIAESGRGKRIRKETEYVKLLRDGLGVVGGKTSGVLPRGMQSGTVVSDGLGSDQATVAVGEPELDYAPWRW